MYSKKYKHECRKSDDCYGECYCYTCCKCQCTREEMYLFIGELIYKFLKDNLELPCGHPSLDEIICYFIKGGELPDGHPSIKEIIEYYLEKNPELKHILCDLLDCHHHHDPCHDHHDCKCDYCCKYKCKYK